MATDQIIPALPHSALKHLTTVRTNKMSLIPAQSTQDFMQQREVSFFDQQRPGGGDGKAVQQQEEEVEFEDDSLVNA